MELKWIGVGLILGLMIVMFTKFTLVTMGIVVLLFIILASFMDWSGEGDGRQGCNRHTNCNH